MITILKSINYLYSINACICPNPPIQSNDQIRKEKKKRTRLARSCLATSREFWGGKSSPPQTPITGESR